VQWSYDLLDDDERAVLGCCSVFAGGFDLAAATAICDGRDEYTMLDRLDSLVRKSLVTTDQVGSHVRYGMLETIRQFAEEQLAAGGSIVAVRDCHARYLADQAIAHWTIWDGPHQRDALDWAMSSSPTCAPRSGGPQTELTSTPRQRSLPTAHCWAGSCNALSRSRGPKRSSQ
jgi:predicted ATPase